MKKKVVCVMLLVGIMAFCVCGCNKKEDVSNKLSEVVESVEESDSDESKSPHDRWGGEETRVVSTPEPTVVPTAEPTIEPTAEPTVEPTTEPTVEPTVEPTTEPTVEPTIEPTEEPIKGAEERENLVNTYADIDLSPYEDYISFDDYSWFKLPEDMFEWDYPTYMSIVCAINEYYGGNVPDNYTCDIKVDVESRETNMVFRVRVHGEKSDLLVGINGYENTASVEEVVE